MTGHPETGTKSTRRLSAEQTYLFKVILPAIWIPVCSTMTVLAFAVDPEVLRQSGFPFPLEIVRWVVLAGFVLGMLSMLHHAIPLKRVDLRGEDLVVSNFRQEITVPLSDVIAVRESRLMNMRPVTLVLNRDTVFGRELTFMPVVEPGWPFRAHSVVAELDARITAAKG